MSSTTSHQSQSSDPGGKLSHKGRVLTFYRSRAIPCPYRDAQAEFLIVPSRDRYSVPYHLYMLHNFRRDGQQIIRPDCPSCHACQAYRVDVNNFTLKRRYRRNLKTNQDLSYQIEPINQIDHYHDLFDIYQATRHPETPTHNSENSLQDFGADFAESVIGVARLGEAVMAVMIIDHSGSTFSAVYTFYDPRQPKRGLGTYMILQLIEQAQTFSYPYIYLGYYVEDCDKLNYKIRFQPGERFSSLFNQWMRS